MISSSRTLAIAGVAVSLALVAGCSGHKSKAPTPTPTTSVTTPSPSPSTSPPPVAAVNPFTGGKPAKNPVVAVKIDDTGNGRPQRGINQADIVYIEEVEGGLTRLLAIFNTTLPTVEAVRSTRANDPELVAQYGPIAYVASGGAPNPLAVLDRSPLKTSINDRGGPGFARDPNRPAPYNLTSNLNLAARTVHGPRATSIGLKFSRLIGSFKTTRALSLRTVVGNTPVGFNWSPSLRRYVRVIDGVVQRDANGQVISTPNVIVQFCKVTPYYADVDVNGNPAAFTHTIGKGRAVIYRDGRKIEAVWSRSRAESGTAFETRSGKRIPLSPGGEWIVLTRTGAPLS